MKAAFSVTEKNSSHPHSSQLQAEALAPLGGLEEESLETRLVWAPHIPAAPHMRLGYWGKWASNRFPKATTDSQRSSFGWPHLVSSQVTNSTYLPWLLGARGPPLLCSGGPTPALGLLVGPGVMHEASLRTLHQFISTLPSYSRL